MPAIAQKNSTKNSKANGRQKASADANTGLPRGAFSLISLVSGAILGLCAPGIGLWPIAWFGLAPLLLLSVSSQSIWKAIWRGLLFGTAYNLVYANFLLGLQPLDWLGFPGWQGVSMAIAAWMILCSYQGILIAIFSGICRALPLHGGFFPEKSKSQWRLPALIVIPLLWMLCVNKIGNAHDLLGIPWTLIEYSQYKQIPIIQICSIIGGIGLSCLMVMVNTCIASFIATVWLKKQNLSLSAGKKLQATSHLIVCALLLTTVVFYGFWQSSRKIDPQTISASVLQGNINIEMQKTTHSYTLNELVTHYKRMLDRCPPGLCVWTENALPCYLNLETATIREVASAAQAHKLDLVVGAMEKDASGRPYNSAYGITSTSKVLPVVYHKRFLVPFGEYTPNIVRNFPDWILRLTNTPAGGGFESGKDPVVLSLNCGEVAPLVCFETLSPELVSSSVRKGAQLLVNVSDLAWFHNSICGEQMTAFSVLRAVENGRYFVFAANTGPSVIIDPVGRITASSGIGKDCVLVGKAGFTTDATAFTKWFIF
jgi:apolipoprotein N-acyltransferase